MFRKFKSSSSLVNYSKWGWVWGEKVYQYQSTYKKDLAIHLRTVLGDNEKTMPNIWSALNNIVISQYPLRIGSMTTHGYQNLWMLISLI